MPTTVHPVTDKALRVMAMERCMNQLPIIQNAAPPTSAATTSAASQ